ncbi:MAG: hypothetical protein ACM3Q4_14610 [Acidobacteriota bacterium]
MHKYLLVLFCSLVLFSNAEGYSRLIVQTDHITASDPCPWVSFETFNPDARPEFWLRFVILRDIVVGMNNPSSVTNAVEGLQSYSVENEDISSTQVEIIVEDGSGATVLDNFYNLQYSGQWYTFNELISPQTGGTYRLKIIVQPGFHDGALLKAYIEH